MAKKLSEAEKKLVAELEHRSATERRIPFEEVLYNIYEREYKDNKCRIE
jgi:hypothetical protein